MKPQFLLLLLVTLLGASYSAYSTATLHCPSDQTMACTAQTTNLMAYGDAYIIKDGVKYDAGLANVTTNLNMCNVGTIVRKWQMEDVNGQIISCTQTLTFEAGNFSEDNITWPQTDLQIDGCESDIPPSSLPQEYQRPIYYFGLCNNIGESYKDTDYTFGPDCIKIVREWTIVDWCRYNPATGLGQYKFYQVIKLSNDSDPILTCPTKTTVVAKECASSYISLPLATATGETCTGGYTITNASIYADTTSNDASGTYPVGDYVIPYQVEYACGAKKNCQTLVSVIEPNPVPYCLATLHIVLMGIDTDNDGAVDDGMAELWAKDVNVGSYHPCDNRPLDFSFEADTLIMSRNFSCENVGRNTINVYVSDADGKQSYCRVDIDVQNNGANIPNCNPTVGNRPVVSGLVTNPIGEAIPEVYVTHKDIHPITEQTSSGPNSWHNVNTEMTNTEGGYSSMDLPMYRTYEVLAYKVGDVSRVTQSDIDLLEAYIKGEASFSSPYTYLAADINEDNKVDVEDFHLMRNLLGAEEAAWPDQRQWVFYTKESLQLQEFNGRAEMPEDTKQTILMNLIDWGYGDHGDFIGILKGDLDYYESLK